MDQEQKRSVIFFGSGPVAARSLSLLATSFMIEGVITKPTTTALMRAVCPETPLYTVTNRKELDDLFLNHAFHSRCGVIIDFGIIVSQYVIDSFKKGIINSHFSLLPQWRGADPITFAILSGQKTTGVSIMLLSEGLDEGPLLAQAPYDIAADATAETLTNALIDISDGLLKEIIPSYLADKVSPAPQESASILGSIQPTYSRKIAKEDSILDWSKPAVQLEREIRAFSTWPKSRTLLGGKEVVVTKARVRNQPNTPGEIAIAGKQLFIGCGDGESSLEILALKPAGKPEMGVTAFLAGYRQFL